MSQLNNTWHFIGTFSTPPPLLYKIVKFFSQKYLLFKTESFIGF